MKGVNEDVYDLEKAVTSANLVLTKCAVDAAPRQQRRVSLSKLRTWTPEIKDAIHRWKMAGRAQYSDYLLLAQKRLTPKVLRQLCRKENAQQYSKDKQKIMDAKTQNAALFHVLIYKHVVS